MNERLKRDFDNFYKAFGNLQVAVDKAKTDLEIDGTIKRFELCYELSWKLIKEVLSNIGIICKNPRDCFKQAFINGLIKDEKNWLMMIDDRNRLVHTYDFGNSREIFENIKKYYVSLYEWLVERVEETK
ncbi:HI0074 family nucleotidyltransferase substrate-binding subunit [Candidatus Acidulodesulfobacterium sp. H_13]|uniref:HI0074 family nucleotidyltransferase substrate-binding subunit n=1 Tax=Candidatus Acidulodesulfobacterium sp. H_13 TaxID=3395470 RepID=UPI003AF44670